MGKNGGVRPNAGRKKGYRKPITNAKRITAAEILAGVDEMAIWRGLLESDSDKIRLEAIQYLTDRRDGKAVQSISNPDGSNIISGISIQFVVPE